MLPLMRAPFRSAERAGMGLPGFPSSSVARLRMQVSSFPKLRKQSQANENPALFLGDPGERARKAARVSGGTQASIACGQQDVLRS